MTVRSLIRRPGTRLMDTLFLATLFLSTLLAANTAQAHKASDSFIYLDTTASELRIDVALRDLALLLPLDKDGNGQLTGAEVRAQRGAIVQTIEQALTLSRADTHCELQGRDWGISHHSDGAYVAARYGVRCPDGQYPEQLQYNLLFDRDSLHRGLVQITSEAGQAFAVLAPDQRTLNLGKASVPSAWRTFRTFVYEGVVHLLVGLDHILFLLVLVIPASLMNRGPSSDHQAPKTTRSRVLELTAVVTAFTVAHSITLGLAALKLVTLPIAWVETVIALSIAVAAINVVWPLLGHKTWKLAFGFGLVHGFGFASVLADLTAGTSDLALALAGFNLGVELGQLGLLLLGFPLLLLASRSTSLYQRVLVPITLAGVVGVSLIWAGQRLPPLF